MSSAGRLTPTGPMSSGVSSAGTSAHQPIVPARRLELSVNPMDGSLLTAPLTNVLLAATDGLYTDLYNMAQGEIDVPIAAAATSEQQDNEAEHSLEPGAEAVSASMGISNTVTTTKKERMSNLSFPKRRHELQSRLYQHAQRIQHVAALTAATAPTSKEDGCVFANAVDISSKALQHARQAWCQADEAQDALYFFHANLFPSRQSPHDIYGASDVLLLGQFLDLPSDLQLTGAVDKYATSLESQLSKTEVKAQWHRTVRDKLVRGEVGYDKLMSPSTTTSMWKITLRGGIVQLTHGTPQKISTCSSAQESSDNNNLMSSLQQSYPISALVTVLSPSTDPSSKLLPGWTLLALHVNVRAKTGEFHHQLETSNRQRYDLHRLAQVAMSREETNYRKKRQELQDKEDDETKPATSSLSLPPPCPLKAMFQVAHTFLLSWQLELLSAQAQALRRGVWAATMGSGAAGRNVTIQVTPVRFFDNHNEIFGDVSVSFWKLDDSYGPPSMGDLTVSTDPSQPTTDMETASTSTAATSKAKHGGNVKDVTYNPSIPTNQYRLRIRAERNRGICVSLSGGSSIMETIANTQNDSTSNDNARLSQTVQQILDATSNPLALSISDALLAATRLCAERKCLAVAEALQRSSIVPDWVLVTVEKASIVVAAKIQYYGLSKPDNGETNGNGASGALPILFRLLCDARTGSFVSVFPRQTELLRQLAANSPESSEAMALRLTSLPQNRQRAGGAHSSGRIVRDAFLGLIRSMNMLGQRTGVGGAWDDIDDKSALLRERSIQGACSDVKLSLIKCCGLAALFGLAPVALGSGVGLNAVPDM